MKYYAVISKKTLRHWRLGFSGGTATLPVLFNSRWKARKAIWKNKLKNVKIVVAPDMWTQLYRKLED